MEKIITKTAEQKAMAWIDEHKAVKTHETVQDSVTTETYVSTNTNFDALVILYEDSEFQSANIRTFSDMEVTEITPDYKEQTLADKLKEEFSQNKLNRGAFLECVEKGFKVETHGNGVVLRRSHSSFYQEGFCTDITRIISEPFTIFVNKNCCKEALDILKEEGFLVTVSSVTEGKWFVHFL